MASSLPPEILTIIAEQAAAQGEALGPYALVCKAWQVAFEAQIYASLVVRSPSKTTTITLGLDGKYGTFEKRGITLDRLAIATGGPEDWSRSRKAAIRSVLYKVAVPHFLSDDKEKWDESSSDEERSLAEEDSYPGSESPSDDGSFAYDNICRRQNDSAFSKGMQSLFELLSTWKDQNRPFSLSIVLQAERVYTPDENIEPGTIGSDGLGDIVATYNASMFGDWHLATVNCVSSLDFPEAWSPVPVNYIEFPYRKHPQPSTVPLAKENGVSPLAALMIASACRGDNLRAVSLDVTHRIPMYERALSLQRRNTVAESLPRLPLSVRKLNIEWQHAPPEYELPEHSSHPICELPSDALCRALRRTSMQLRVLNVSGLEVLPELFSSLDSSTTVASYWPNLEILRAKDIPWTTSSGFKLLYVHGPSSEKFICPSFLDDTYTSIGLAACNMPRIKTIEIFFNGYREKLNLRKRHGRRVLAIVTHTSYTPDSRVWGAWKVNKRPTTYGGLKIRSGERWWEVEWNLWPPQ